MSKQISEEVLQREYLDKDKTLWAYAYTWDSVGGEDQVPYAADGRVSSHRISGKMGFSPVRGEKQYFRCFQNRQESCLCIDLRGSLRWLSGGERLPSGTGKRGKMGPHQRQDLSR